MTTIDNLRLRGLLHVAVQVANRYHLTVDELLEDKESPAPAARAELYTFLHPIYQSTTRVARLFGRDHTTIISAMRSLKGTPYAPRACGCGRTHPPITLNPTSDDVTRNPTQSDEPKSRSLPVQELHA